MIRNNRYVLSTILLIMILIMTGCPSPTSSDNDSGTEYSITFNKNNDQATGTMVTQSGVDGDKIYLTANSFSLSGYGFTGWSTSPSGSVEYGDGSTYIVGKSDVTLYAQWGQYHSITFNKNNDQATGTMVTQSGVEGNKIQLTANSFFLNSYRFSGWSTDPSGSVKYEDMSEYTVDKSDVTLYAQWEAVYFRTRWNVTGTTLRFPLYEGGTYDFTINWGDGNSENITNDDVSSVDYIVHIYSDPGTYEVIIQGTCNGFGYSPGFYNQLNGSIVDVMEWGDVSLNNMGMQFRECDELTSFSAEDILDISNITNMSMMFFHAGNFNGDISAWDVSNVTDMSVMFGQASSFNQDISAWDVKNVTDMSEMFISTNNFDQDISAWDVSNVITMYAMFEEASFNQDISSWDVKNVTEMDYMFADNQAFNQDISVWDVGNVTSMEFMFYGASSFNKNISAWGSKVPEDTDHDDFSFNCPLLPEYHPYDSWNN